MEKTRQHSAVTWRIKLAGFAMAVLLLPSAPSTAQNALSPHTPTEIFHLRSERVALGDKIVDSPAPAVRTYVSESEITHYDLQSNRCYVAVAIHFVDGTSRFLYDGQTREQLASAHYIVGTGTSKMWGAVSDQNHQVKTVANFGWDDATAYIHEKMAEDDRFQ